MDLPNAAGKSKDVYIQELESTVEKLQAQVVDLTRQNSKLQQQNAKLKNQVPVGTHTTAANTATPESSIWNVMDRLGRRERFFNEDQNRVDPSDGNTLKDKIKRFAAPRKSKTVKVCMNGKWVSVKPWMVQEKTQMLRQPAPTKAPVQGKLIRTLKSAVTVPQQRQHEIIVKVCPGGVVHWEWAVEEPGLDIGFCLKQGGLMGERLLRWDGMMNDTGGAVAGRYTGTVMGQWAGPSGNGTSDECTVIFAWDNSYSKMTKKTISFHIRVFCIDDNKLEGTSGKVTAGSPERRKFSLDEDDLVVVRKLQQEHEQ